MFTREPSTGRFEAKLRYFFAEGIDGSGEGMKPTFRLLTDEQQSAIAAAAFELLKRVGVKLTESEAQALLYGAGAPVPPPGAGFVPDEVAEQLLCVFI